MKGHSSANELRMKSVGGKYSRVSIFNARVGEARDDTAVHAETTRSAPWYLRGGGR